MRPLFPSASSDSLSSLCSPATHLPPSRLPTLPRADWIQGACRRAECLFVCSFLQSAPRGPMPPPALPPARRVRSSRTAPRRAPAFWTAAASLGTQATTAKPVRAGSLCFLCLGVEFGHFTAYPGAFVLTGTPCPSNTFKSTTGSGVCVRFDSFRSKFLGTSRVE